MRRRVNASKGGGRGLGDLLDLSEGVWNGILASTTPDIRPWSFGLPYTMGLS